MLRSTLPVAAAMFAAAAAAQTVVVPNGTALTEGNSSNAFPWGRGGAGLLHQCVYDSSHFTLQGITQPIAITGLAWRPNTGVALTPSTYTTASVWLSTCPVDQSAVTTNLASNRGSDHTQCYTGPVGWAAQPAVTGPTPFGISVPFTTPFVYDPASGDLNIECDLPIQPYGGGMPQLDVQTTGALASRVYVSTGYPAGAGTLGPSHGVVVQVSYVPATGLHAAFDANVTSGTSPLSVTFTDRSYSGAPGGVVSWAWDFDNDGVVDSTLQNPSHTYTSCGTYTVSLTVGDGVNPPSTRTRTDYVTTDVVTPSFTASVLTPGVLQFTDTSTPAATSWAWDFDGDQVVDSTLQNPTWSFGAPCGTRTVSMVVHRLCKGPFTATQTVTLSPNTFTTSLSGGTGLGGVGSGNTFDVVVTNPTGVTICALEVTPYMATPVVGTPMTCTIWVTDAPGGYLANHTNAAVWRQVATGAGLYAGGTLTAPVPVCMTLSNTIHLPLGTFGMAVHVTAGTGIAYTTIPSQASYVGPDFTIVAGNGKSAPFNATANSPRAFNGRFHYSTPTSGGLAGYGFFGAGCPGTLGIPHVLNTTQPTIGGTLSANVDNLQFAIAVMVLGVSNTLSGGAIPLPMDLTFLGAPGCSLRVSLDATDTVVGAGTTATWSFHVPNNPALLGVQLYNQAASLDSTNAFGFVMSDAYAWVVGH